MRIIDNSQWQNLAGSLEADRGLPEGMLRAIALNETNGGDLQYLDAPSSAGAMGMFQFMPATAKEYNVNVSDPADSTRGAADYLERLMKKYSDPHLAAAAYNWGQGNLDKAIKKAADSGYATDANTLADGGFLPRETANYIRKLDIASDGTKAQKNEQIVIDGAAWDGAKREIEDMFISGASPENMFRTLSSSPISPFVERAVEKGYGAEDIIRSIIGSESYAKGLEIRDQSGLVNVGKGAKTAISDVVQGAKQLGARVSGDDQRLADLQQQQAARENSFESRMQDEQTGTGVGSFAVKAIPYAAAAAATGGAAVPLIAGQAAIGAIDGALTPTTDDGQFTNNILKSAALAGGSAGAGLGLGKLLGKSLAAGASPEAAAERSALIQRANAEGLPVSPSNVSPFWKGVAEANAGSKTINSANEAVDAALAKRIAKGLGEEDYSGPINTNLLNSARERIGATYGAVLDDVTIQIPRAMRDNLDDIVARNVNPLTEGIANNATVAKAISNIKTAQETNAAVSARQLQDLSSELKELTRSQTASATEKKLAGKVVEQINKTINDALTPEQRAAYKVANSQYRNLKAVEKMVQLSNDSGVVSPRQMVQAIKSGQFKNSFLKDEAPFQELATTAAELYGPANGRGLGDVIGKALNSNNQTLGAASILEPTIGLPALLAKKIGSKGMQKLATTRNPTLVRLLSGSRSAQLDPVTREYIAKALGASGAVTANNK